MCGYKKSSETCWLEILLRVKLVKIPDCLNAAEMSVQTLASVTMSPMCLSLPCSLSS